MKNIVFIGSSIVAGNFGVDWISKLPVKNGVKYHNYGINGAQVPTVINFVKSNRINFVPYAVIIMVGGNDVTNSVPIKKYGGFSMQRDGRLQTNSTRYGEEMEELFQLIVSKWGELPIGVFNLKPHSEDVHGKLNKIVEEFNASLVQRIQQRTNVTLIDMYTPLITSLQNRTPSPRADDIEYVVDVGRMLYVFIMRYLTFGYYSQNDFSEARGFYLFCDGLHFNERAAAIVLKSIEPFLTKLLATDN